MAKVRTLRAVAKPALLLSIIVAFSTCLFAAAPVPKWRLVPRFSTVMDNPQFQVDYMNESEEIKSRPKLIETSAIVLDGKEYANPVVMFAGNPRLSPGEHWIFDVDLGGYLPSGEKQQYSSTLKRWRWKNSLQPGKHTIVLRLDGRESEPLEFYWDTQFPLLYQ
jgi:hypothetical protein